MKQKRTKKYNPTKHTNITAEAAVKNYYLLMNLAITGKDVVMFHTKHKKCYAPTNNVQKLFKEHRFVWHYVIVVYATEANGKERTATAYLKAPYACQQHEIYKSLNAAHSQLIAEQTNKGNNVHNAAWAAIPYDLGNLNEAEQEALIQECLHYLEIYDD
ncbi:MAG: hypothetical protein CMC55_08770 [Flavobacteriaceae bacterium]|nr:hypothetical protein [Flavobacteriaceae bacterium]|tara:strand:- start:76 stop:552 length:477 start_codon:yes stop_codon:yes gene_type:complete